MPPAVRHATAGLLKTSSPTAARRAVGRLSFTDPSGVAIDSIVVVTGSAWLRIMHEDETSLCVLHRCTPFGSSVIRMLQEDPLEAIASLRTACRDLTRTIGGRWSCDPRSEQKEHFAQEALIAACAACALRDDDLEYVEASMEWSEEGPKVSFASSGAMDAPAPSDVLLSMLEANGPVNAVACSRTWQIAGRLMPGPSPTWDDPDGIVFEDGRTVAFEARDILERMRLLSRGAEAAKRLGIDMTSLVNMD